MSVTQSELSMLFFGEKFDNSPTPCVESWKGWNFDVRVVSRCVTLSAFCASNKLNNRRIKADQPFL
jgi:hypothetical protein